MIQLKTIKQMMIKIAVCGALFAFLAVIFFVIDAPVVSAQVDIISGTEAVGEAAGLATEDLRVVIARIIRGFLGILGAVALIIVIYGGYLYMTSGGDPAKVEKAKKVLINAAIGLAIIMMSFAIVSFIIGQLQQALSPPSVTPGVTYVAPGTASGALGAVIQDHFPGVGMIVPRNTVVMVTFKEPINPFSIIRNDDDRQCATPAGDSCVPPVAGQNCICRGNVNTAAMQIYRACDTVYAPSANAPDDYTEANRANPSICNAWRGDQPTNEDLFVSDGDVVMTGDFRTVIFNPYGTDPVTHLGSPVTDITYITRLTNTVTRLDTGVGVFTGQPGGNYRWDFTTNTTIDLTPPYITGVYPVTLGTDGQPIDAVATGAGLFPRNTKIRIDFSEPVLPPLYQNITLPVDSEVLINSEVLISSGEFAISGTYQVGINNYRSVVFSPNGSCGANGLMNSCGDPVYCLPENAVIENWVRSVPIGNLIEGGPTAAIYPAGGIVDVALNALDTDGRLGRGNEVTEGDEDDFLWSFKTSDEIDLVPPRISVGVNPVDGVSIGLTPQFGDDKNDGVTPQSIVSAFFTKSMDPATATNVNLSIFSNDWNGWYTGSMYCPITIDDNGQGSCTTNDRVVVINHADFSFSDDPSSVPLFFPKMASGLQDMSGNCFNPVQGPHCENIEPGKACCAAYDPETGGQMIIQEGETCPY